MGWACDGEQRGGESRCRWADVNDDGQVGQPKLGGHVSEMGLTEGRRAGIVTVPLRLFCCFVSKARDPRRKHKDILTS